MYPHYFVMIIVIYFILAFLRAAFVSITVIGSSTGMHAKMAQSVIRAKIVFFDSNPIGRIVTRFSKDLVVLDIVLPGIAVMSTAGIFRALTVAISVAVVNHYILFSIAIALVLMVYILKLGSTAMNEA
jgi:ATP-binding cassette subfamily C (CFTR/MRP) protein 4